MQYYNDTVNTMNGFLVLLLTTLIRDSQGIFYLSTEDSTWFIASSLCTLGAPEFTRTSGGLHVDLPGINLYKQEKVWTGFYRTMKILEYIDCVNLDDIKQTDVQFLYEDIKGSLAKCTSECGRSDLVAVTYSKCFCINDGLFLSRKRSKETNCTTQCRYPRGVACGFENGNGTYLSVYKLYENERPSETGAHTCTHPTPYTCAWPYFGINVNTSQNNGSNSVKTGNRLGSS